MESTRILIHPSSSLSGILLFTLINYILLMDTYLNNGHAIHTCMLNTNVYIPVCHNPRSQLPHEYIWPISGIVHAHHSCGGKQGKLSGSRLSTIFKFASIQVSDTITSSGYFRNFLTK